MTCTLYENNTLYEWTELLYPFSIRDNNIIQSEYGYNIPTMTTISLRS